MTDRYVYLGGPLHGQVREVSEDALPTEGLPAKAVGVSYEYEPHPLHKGIAISSQTMNLIEGGQFTLETVLVSALKQNADSLYTLRSILQPPHFS